MTQTRTPLFESEALTEALDLSVLHLIGTALDDKLPLQVSADGIVSVMREPDPPRINKDLDHERKRQRRSATRSRKGTAGRQGTPRGSRTSGATPRLSGDVLRQRYEGQLEEIRVAYPSVRSFPDADGIWLLVKSRILEEVAREATFLIALPCRPGLLPRAWGFWTSKSGNRWIGPRHTNFQDGSVCAFAPEDNVWVEGGNITALIDLYSVWALRHLHLEFFGRWPGKQYALLGADPLAQAYYRSRECRPDELCGCGSETRRYAECCKPYDDKISFSRAATHFMNVFPGGFSTRQPPPAVVRFLDDEADVPRIRDVHLQMRTDASF